MRCSTLLIDGLGTGARRAHNLLRFGGQHRGEQSTMEVEETLGGASDGTRNKTKLL